MNIGILTSGGDAPGMNAAIRAAVRKGLAEQCRIFGFLEGFKGLTENKFITLDSQSVSEIIDRGGTILRTARYEKFEKPKTRAQAAGNLMELEIDALIVVGGNGSMAGADKLSEEGVGVIGVPASIDNDVFGTDFSIGFDTACNTVVGLLSKLRDTASAHERIFVIEVMGRQCGAIALYSGMAGGADHICLPETPATDEREVTQMSELVERRYKQGKTHTLIIVAEGSGSAKDVADAIHDRTGREVRVSVLGHIQRGGSPSVADRLLASRLAAQAVDLAIAGETGLMVGLEENRVTATRLRDTYSNPVHTDAQLLDLASVLS
jgi:6-phosphofructokinase 1